METSNRQHLSLSLSLCLTRFLSADDSRTTLMPVSTATFSNPLELAVQNLSPFC